MASAFPLFFIFFLLITTAFSLSVALKIPKLGLVRESTHGKFLISQSNLNEISSSGYKFYNYSQTIDHFNYRPESYDIFQQRYAINDKYWGGAKNNSPIFVYTGDEASLESVIRSAGFLVDNAPHFQALLVVIEHRYYGESNPFGSRKQAYQNTSTLGYFSSTQALADYAQLITELKKNLSANNCPVIAMGGSYGGMLASWFRLKYPHIVIGAFASSAPILYFDDITPENGYLSIVTKDFQETSKSCYRTIRESWFEIDKFGLEINGLSVLSQIFHTCRPLNNTPELKDALASIYSAAAQYDDPTTQPVNLLCSGIDGAFDEATILERVFTGITPWNGKKQCFDIDVYNIDDSASETAIGWYWQTCSEMVMPIGCDSNDTMFQAQPFNIYNYTMDCQKKWGVTPRPHWMTTEFGGHNIKSVLRNFGSNIIFSNGLRDPYSSGGVLCNISDTIVAIYTTQGSHCLDILPATPADPEWLIAQRNEEVKIIERWIAEYKANIIA
ncbi:lysosomal Pro-X carboxypeptidase-like isoform X2 [Asparagus officinalis]|uniref:lysosomal Pro-X carboxypeptidase-like isoform X2 n=1 Tax=Asparagus officinalis TaxID=4686 RepID=UPI00098E4A56|nr:lysosomal Pro-X carboxypeptidase-like isoform X2 [Asparagus officinalis]